jgi:hypothetical protein
VTIAAREDLTLFCWVRAEKLQVENVIGQSCSMRRDGRLEWRREIEQTVGLLEKVEVVSELLCFRYGDSMGTQMKKDVHRW